MAPSGAGTVLVDSILADMKSQGLSPDAREGELLVRARACANRIAELEKAVRQSGSTFTDKDGVVRPSPMLAEIRSTTLVLARCLNGVQMTQATKVNTVKQRAGQASWEARKSRQDMKSS
jgi:hypothetical protein